MQCGLASVYVYHTPPSTINTYIVSYNTISPEWRCKCKKHVCRSLAPFCVPSLTQWDLPTSICFIVPGMLHYLGILFGWYATGICLYKHELCNMRLLQACRRDPNSVHLSASRNRSFDLKNWCHSQRAMVLSHCLTTAFVPRQSTTKVHCATSQKSDDVKLKQSKYWVIHEFSTQTTKNWMEHSAFWYGGHEISHTWSNAKVN